MSVRSVVALLILTLLLAGVALWTIRPPARATLDAAPGSRLLTLDLAAVTKLRLRIADNSGAPAAQTSGEQVITKAPSNSGMSPTSEAWTWQPAPPTPTNSTTPASPARAWPLDPTRVRALLRLIAEARVLAPAPAGQSLPEDALTLTIEPNLGVLRIARRALAGGVLASFTPPGSTTPAAPVLIDATLLNVLTQPGPSAWRPRQLLGELALTATRITITSPTTPTASNATSAPTQTIQLRKRADRWDLLAPVAAPADTTVAQALAAALERLTITRYISDEAITPQRAGLTSPSATITLTRESTSGAASAAATLTLILGSTADAAGTSLYASIDDGTTIVTLDAPQLTPLQLSANLLVAKPAASDLQAPDIAAIDLTGPAGTLSLTRTPAGWTLQNPGALQSTPLDPQQSRVAQSLPGFFTAVAADAIDLLMTAPTGPATTITLRDSKNNPLAVIAAETADTADTADTAPLTLTTGQVRRSYKTPPAELRQWLSLVR